MKRLVIVLASVVLGVLIGLVLFVVQGKEKELGEEVSMTAKMEPMVESLDKPSIPQIGELFGEKAMEVPQFLEAEAFFPPKREAGPIEEALIEAPVKAETEVTASDEDPEVVANNLKKNNLAAEAIPAKEMTPANKMLLKFLPAGPVKKNGRTILIVSSR